MRGAYDVTFNQGDKLFVIVGESLAKGFIRADLNGMEIELTKSEVEVDGNTYKVYTSEPWNAGSYNIDING